MYYTYVIQNKDGLIYVGQTENLKRRFEQHNTGTGAQFTKGRGPWHIVFYNEFRTRKSAMLREKYLQSKPGMSSIRLTLRAGVHLPLARLEHQASSLPEGAATGPSRASDLTLMVQ